MTCMLDRTNVPVKPLQMTSMDFVRSTRSGRGAAGTSALSSPCRPREEGRREGGAAFSDDVRVMGPSLPLQPSPLHPGQRGRDWGEPLHPGQRGRDWGEARERQELEGGGRRGGGRGELGEGGGDKGREKERKVIDGGRKAEGGGGGGGGQRREEKVR